MMPKLAIVREPGDSYSKCISCHPLRHTIDVGKARRQHAEYCRVLADLGLELIKVPRDDENPDSCFVEDNAVIHRGKALICRMAKDSRRGEIGAVESILKGMVKVRRASAPATMEGGDVVHFSDRLLSGVTQRTNSHGISQMREWLDVKVDTVEDPSIVHLKSYVTYLGRDFVISMKRYSKHPTLKGFTVLVVPEDEGYAADTLTIGDTVLMARGRPKSQALVKDAGFDVVSLDVSEIEKCEGALTCLSLIL
ncbi:MAG: arginine deiminase family protein [Thermoplasmata archaeon]|nr:arginine deiminase family protein [Thermoplasmata archaeon]